MAREVLVLADSAQTGDNYRACLDPYGWEVILASWSDAEQLLTRDCRFGMILMDVQKPGIVSEENIGAVDRAGSLEGIQGIEISQIIENIRNSGRPHLTPILVLGSGIPEEEQERLYRAGVNVYWVKPVSPTELGQLTSLLAGGEEE